MKSLRRDLCLCSNHVFDHMLTFQRVTFHFSAGVELFSPASVVDIFGTPTTLTWFSFDKD